MKPTKKLAVRAGSTEKVSVSIDRTVLAALRRRARRLYAGNLSAVIAEGIRRVREEEGREALVEWLAEAAETTPEQRAAILAEWSGPTATRRRRSRRAA